MGGGDQGAASAQTTQQLLEEMKRQQTASQIQGAFNKLGAGVGTQLPYMQQPQAQPLPQAAPPPVPQVAGPLFPQGGMGGGGGAGIDPQQLAMILQRLGYGG
jgi:hypothetical protein